MPVVPVLCSATQQEEQGALSYVHTSGVGVAVLISPWNLPLYLLTFKIAPALAAGNAVVCKPSEMTSATAFLLARICLDAALPPGALPATVLHYTAVCLPRLIPVFAIDNIELTRR